MKSISRKEEEVLRVLCQLEKAFVKDVLAAMPGPNKPAYNTISTVIRRLEDKGYVGHEDFGSTYRYYPLISLEQLKSRNLSSLVNNYFNSSYKDVVAHFARHKQLGKKDLEEILRMIEEE